MGENKTESILMSAAMGVLSWLLLSHVFSPSSYRQAPKVSAFSLQAEQLVNQHLQNTQRIMTLEQAKIAKGNLQTAPEIGQQVVPKIPTAQLTYRVEHDADTNETNAYRDMNRYPHERQNHLPNQIVQRELSADEELRFYKAMYQKKYAQQFIENARQGGYEVKLDEDYVVVGVTPIRRNPGALDLRKSSGAGAQ